MTAGLGVAAVLAAGVAPRLLADVDPPTSVSVVEPPIAPAIEAIPHSPGAVVDRTEQLPSRPASVLRSPPRPSSAMRPARRPTATIPELQPVAPPPAPVEPTDWPSLIECGRG